MHLIKEWSLPKRASNRRRPVAVQVAQKRLRGSDDSRTVSPGTDGLSNIARRRFSYPRVDESPLSFLALFETAHALRAGEHKHHTSRRQTPEWAARARAKLFDGQASAARPELFAKRANFTTSPPLQLRLLRVSGTNWSRARDRLYHGDNAHDTPLAADRRSAVRGATQHPERSRAQVGTKRKVASSTGRVHPLLDTVESTIL